MESPFWPESFSSNPTTPIQGQHLTRKVHKIVQVGPTSAVCVAVQHLEMLDNFSSIMRDYSDNRAHVPYNGTCFSHGLESVRSTNVNSIVKTVKSTKNKKGRYIRKSSSTSIQVTSLIDDGHTWRKYGQKEIINARHKRNYYRCTHKFDQGCQATKQVQKIEDVPQKYKVTYHRHHSCKNFLGTTPQIFLDYTSLNDTSVLLNFESNELIPNDKVGAHFPLHTQEKPKDGFSSPESMHNQSSLFDNNPIDNLIRSDLSEPVSQISSRLEVIAPGVYSPLNEIGHILEGIDWSQTPFDFTYVCDL